MLPGTMDESGKGLPNVVSHVDRLSRKFEYNGPAWYQREVVVPKDWADMDITLCLERCHWETAVFVDGQPIATDERLSTPNRFNLTKQLTPGVHTLTICVDNRLKYPMDQWNHGTTEYTQTNWNGIVGEISLTAQPKNRIRKVSVFPDVANKQVKVRTEIQDILPLVDNTLTLEVREKQGKVVQSTQVVFQKSDSVVLEVVEIGRAHV